MKGTVCKRKYCSIGIICVVNNQTIVMSLKSLPDTIRDCKLNNIPLKLLIKQDWLVIV